MILLKGNPKRLNCLLIDFYTWFTLQIRQIFPAKRGCYVSHPAGRVLTSYWPVYSFEWLRKMTKEILIDKGTK